MRGQKIPWCSACEATNEAGETSAGILKPDIVFFHESLPDRFHDAIEGRQRISDEE